MADLFLVVTAIDWCRALPASSFLFFGGGDSALLDGGASIIHPVLRVLSCVELVGWTLFSPFFELTNLLPASRCFCSFVSVHFNILLNLQPKRRAWQKNGDDPHERQRIFEESDR
jgi:hypothetical protein